METDKMRWKKKTVILNTSFLFVRVSSITYMRFIFSIFPARILLCVKMLFFIYLWAKRKRETEREIANERVRWQSVFDGAVAIHFLSVCSQRCESWLWTGASYTYFVLFLHHQWIRLCHFNLNHLHWNDIEAILRINFLFSSLFRRRLSLLFGCCSYFIGSSCACPFCNMFKDKDDYRLT